MFVYKRSETTEYGKLKTSRLNNLRILRINT